MGRDGERRAFGAEGGRAVEMEGAEVLPDWWVLGGVGGDGDGGLTRGRFAFFPEGGDEAVEVEVEGVRKGEGVDEAVVV